MTVSRDNYRRYITFPKELIMKLEELGKREHRPFNNLVIHIIKEYMDNKEIQTHKENNKNT